MIDHSRDTFHHGVLVDDVDEAMAELGASLGLNWASVQHAPERSVWTPEHGLEHVALTFVYSTDGPTRVELLQGATGSVWDPAGRTGFHHVGVWSDDVTADASALTALGWTVTAAASSPEDGYGSFAYVVPPSGPIVELVSSAARPRFESWWSGGVLGHER